MRSYYHFCLETKVVNWNDKKNIYQIQKQAIFYEKSVSNFVKTLKVVVNQITSYDNRKNIKYWQDLKMCKKNSLSHKNPTLYTENLSMPH